MTSASKIDAALVVAQKAVESVRKSATHYQGFKYAPADEVIVTGRAALNEAGLTLTEVKYSLTPYPAALAVAVAEIAVVYRLAHESGEARELVYVVPVVPERGRPLDKAVFAALTEGLSYAYRGVLSIHRTDDPTVTAREDAAESPKEPRQERKAKGVSPAPRTAPPADDATIKALAQEHAAAMGNAKGAVDLETAWEGARNQLTELGALDTYRGVLETAFAARATALMGAADPDALGELAAAVARAKLKTADIVAKLRASYEAAYKRSKGAA